MRTKVPAQEMHGDEENAANAIISQEIKSLSQRRINKIFGPGVMQSTGHDILIALQGNRLAGTLDADLELPEHFVSSALKWLRKTSPLDEAEYILRRLEREDREAEEAAKNWKPQQRAETDGIYGSSEILDKIKERQKEHAQRADEIRAVKEAKARDEPQTRDGGHRPLSLTRPERRLEPSPWTKTFIEKGQSTLKEPPKMTVAERLVPSALFAVAVIGLSVLFAQTYKPPSKKARLWPDIPPAAATVVTLIGMNVVIFLMWRWPPLYGFMNRYCLLVTATPNYMTILGNTFSHQQLSHLLSNMVVLWIFGTRLCDDVGRGTFVAMYLSFGVLSSFTSLSYHVFRNMLPITSLGASGVTSGIMAAWCVIHINKRLKITGVDESWTSWLGPLLSPLALLTAFVAVEVASISKGFGVNTFLFRFLNQERRDHMAHLGGFAAGIGAGELVKYRARRRGQRRSERQKQQPGVNAEEEGQAQV